MLKIASWNVNSLNVRLPHLLAWSAAAQPDVLALQETKLTDDRFPVEELRVAGYYSLFSGQKTYNGVAVLSRQAATDPVTDIPGLDDHQRRILAATVGDVRVVNLYVVNGSEVGSEKFEYKLRWLQCITDWLAGELRQHANLVVLGDFNIAPDDRDVYDPEEWREKILCSTPERQALGRILGCATPSGCSTERECSAGGLPDEHVSAAGSVHRPAVGHYGTTLHRQLRGPRTAPRSALPTTRRWRNFPGPRARRHSGGIFFTCGENHSPLIACALFGTPTPLFPNKVRSYGSIPRDGRIDLHRPGVDAADDIADVGEALLAEVLRRAHARVAMMAKEGDRGVLGHGFEPLHGLAVEHQRTPD
jgi:exodeoxyribonuclease-3